MDSPFVPVKGSVAFPALRLVELAPCASSQQWTLLPVHRYRSARGYAAACHTVCLSLEAFLDACRWYRGEDEAIATGNAAQPMPVIAAHRADDRVIEPKRAGRGKRLLRWCVLVAGVLAGWLIADSMPGRVARIAPHRYPHVFAAQIAENAATLLPERPSGVPTVAAPPKQAAPAPADARRSSSTEHKKLAHARPASVHRMRADGSRERTASSARVVQYDVGPVHAVTLSDRPHTHTDSTDWIDHLPQRRVTEIADAFSR